MLVICGKLILESIIMRYFCIFVFHRMAISARLGSEQLTCSKLTLTQVNVIKAVQMEINTYLNQLEMFQF